MGLASFTGPYPAPNWNDELCEAEMKIIMMISSYLQEQGVVPGGAGSAASSKQPAGANNVVTGQLTTGTSTNQIRPAVPTRTGLALINIDPANTVYIGPVGVTSAIGMPIPPGASITVTATVAWYAIASAGTPILGYTDESN